MKKEENLCLQAKLRLGLCGYDVQQKRSGLWPFFRWTIIATRLSEVYLSSGSSRFDAMYRLIKLLPEFQLEN